VYDDRRRLWESFFASAIRVRRGRAAWEL
jgi:hypothetical protein